jgi:7-keto-8-aminopelargonate synthetase-like enzyme
MSRTYISNPLYRQLEQDIQAMYNAPVVISKNCTLSHQTTIPSIIRQSDLVILDHQAHASIQEAVKKMLGQGVSVEMIRHNNLEMLEDRIKKQRSKYDRIWYMADGVYSMYGDFAPIKELIALAEKYEQLYLYVDDAHGMSWAGKDGTGYVMSQMDGLYRKMILTANLGKAFGACGGLSVFPNEEWYNRVNNFGGPLTFSVQIEPATLGAALASAKIHRSEEIYDYQEKLQKRILYCNSLLRQTGLPLVVENESPIFFIGTGTMEMGNYLVQDLIQEGVYVNLATFPAVPAKNIGIRFTISLNNTFEDIEIMVDKLKACFEKALVATNQTDERIRKAFKMEAPATTALPVRSVANDNLSLLRYNTITDIDAGKWDQFLGHRGMFDWKGLLFLEKAFRDNEEKENNWDFHYYIVEDASARVVLMTFFVTALHKEDMFSRVSISRVVEEERLINPYYLTSTGIIMGSLFTEGTHLYLDRESTQWRKAFTLMMEEIYKVQEKTSASNIMIRDLDSADPELKEFMVEQGFVKVDLPESCVVEDLTWDNEEQFLATLTKENKKNYNRYVKRFEQNFDVAFHDQLPEAELQHAIGLFRNVKNKNLGINIFHFPDKLFQEMNLDPQWEFLTLTLKKELGETDKPVMVCFCHKNSAQVYSFLLTGIDYDYNIRYGSYRQGLYQLVKRARALGYKKANFGISAAIEKKRVGAKLHPKVGYFQAKDNFAMEMMEATIAIGKE